MDLLVLTRQGFWLVEIQNRPGRVGGDAGTWTRTDRDGRRVAMDSPVLMANRRARALSGLLRPSMAARRMPMPWINPLVFLSDPDLRCDLAGVARNRVCPADRDAEEGRPGRKGILAALVGREAAGSTPGGRGSSAGSGITWSPTGCGTSATPDSGRLVGAS